MESLSEQALLLGVNLFILIISLTCAIMLMTAVLNMSNSANTVIKTTTDSTLMMLYGGTSDRIYTGEQALITIEEYFSQTSHMDEKYVFMLNGITVAGSDDNKNITFTKNMLDSTYHLRYIGKESKTQRYIYNFEKVQEEVESE